MSGGYSVPHSPLVTDLYQLSMVQAYLDEGLTDQAVFEFYVRSLPEHRNFLIAAGLRQVVEWLQACRFSAAELDWMDRSGQWSREFLDYLAAWRFTGSVRAMAEGTPFFSDEPILQVTAPLPEAQLIESRVINFLHYQTIVASKAVRCVLAAGDRLLVDFGLRRAHGAEAGLFAARAAYLAGFTGTASVMAGKEYDIPLFGTMAHSYIQAHTCELEAFRQFSRIYPDYTTLLIDTYDTERGARRVAEILPELKAQGIGIGAVRLDSGDLVQLSRAVRRILDDAGYPDIRIFCSGGLDEFEIVDLLARGAVIDGLGIGTALTVCADAPYLDCAYKLQEYAGIARRKRSTRKSTWPGPKQVWRNTGDDGVFRGDTITVHDEVVSGAIPLLESVMHQGEQVGEAPSLGDIREYCRQQVGSLPAATSALKPAKPYPVEISGKLRELASEVDARTG